MRARERTLGIDDVGEGACDPVNIDAKSPFTGSHSRRTAEVAEALAGRLHLAPGPTVEVRRAALLHDVGKLVMSRFVEPVDLKAIEMVREAGITRIQAETEVLGVNHAELGGLIATKWELPETLVRGIAYHHVPQHPAARDEPGAGLIAYGVHVADVVAKAVGAGRDDNAELETFAEAMGELGLSADAYDEICRLVRDRFSEVASRFT